MLQLMIGKKKITKYFPLRSIKTGKNANEETATEGDSDRKKRLGGTHRLNNQGLDNQD